MYKTTVKINGMACGMCESHICDVIRKQFPDAKKVSASHTKNEATFLTENQVDGGVLEDAIEKTGYHYVSASTEPYEKKKHGLFGFGR